MKIKILKYIKITGLSLVILLSILILLTLLLNLVFKDQLINYAVSKLNEQVDARISIRKVDFSVWRKFPNVSVELEEVYAQSSNTYKKNSEISSKDTLLLAKEVFLEFNLYNLLVGRFDLAKLSVNNGTIKLIQDKNGSNFNIIRKSEKPSEKDFIFSLENVLLNNMELSYNNLNTFIDIITYTEKLNLKGNFRNSGFDLNIASALKLKSLKVKSAEYVHEKNLEMYGDLQHSDSLFQISNFKVSVQSLKFVVDGQLKNNEIINISSKGEKIDLSKVMDALPTPVKKKINGFSGKGVSDVQLCIQGKVNQPRIDLKFSLKGATITQKATGTKVKEINASGSYTYTTYSSLILQKFSARLKDGHFQGSASISDLDKPKLKLNVDYSLYLNDLKDFLNLNSFEIFNGFVSGNIIASSTLPGWKSLKLSDFSDLTCKGEATLHNAGIQAKGSNYFFEQINGTILFDRDFFFNGISVNLHENDFLINGSLSGALEYLFRQRSMVTLNAEIESKYLDLSRYFLPKINTENQTVSPGYSRELLFPENINLNVKVKINEFKLKRFRAKNINGYVNYKPKIFVLKSFGLESLSGKITGNGVILQDLHKNFVVKGQSEISMVDIQQMFYAFNNFSQDVIQDKHIRGRVSGTVNFSSDWNNALAFNQDRLLVDADVTVFNGQLIKFGPMSGLSKFIALEELQNIKFTTLKNHIQIKDKQIIIPKMDIVSSAFSIAASGIHTFDNHYNYKLRVQLSDVLGKKARKSKKENEEFGEIEDDGLGRTSIPLSVTGYRNDYKIKYDPKMALTDVRENMKKQGTELKTILKEEFGWFKNDTTLSSTKTVKKANPRVVWDDAVTEVKDQKPAQTKKSAKTETEEKPKIEWE